MRTWLDTGTHCTTQSDHRKFGDAEATGMLGKSHTSEKNIRHWPVSVVAQNLHTWSKYSYNIFRGKFVHLLKLHWNSEILFSKTLYRRADRSIESNISVINIYKFIWKPSYVVNNYKNTRKYFLTICSDIIWSYPQHNICASRLMIIKTN